MEIFRPPLSKWTASSESAIGAPSSQYLDCYGLSAFGCHYFQNEYHYMVEIKLPTGVFKYDPSMPLGKPGGFGQVFLGQTANGDEVAFKRLHVSAADTAHRELRIAEELKGKSHEHVIGFIDAGEDADSGNYFVVMTKAERSLREALEKSGPLTAGETISVLLQIVQDCSRLES